MSPFFTSAALIGIITAAWSKIKVLLARAWSVFFVKVTVSGYLAVAIKAYCWQNFRRSPFGTKRFLSATYWVRPIHKPLVVAYEALSTDPILFWNGFKAILLGASTTDTKGGREIADDHTCTLSFIRGTFDIDEFLTRALDQYNGKFGVETKKTLQRFTIAKYFGRGNARGGLKDSENAGSSPPSGLAYTDIQAGEYRFLKWDKEELGPEVQIEKNALDALSLPPEAMQAIEDAKHWLASEKWYRDRQIPWTRGWLLYGPPGTGKSSVIRALGEDLDLPIFIFDLSSMSNSDFQSFWNTMKTQTPCIAAFEDVDAVFHGRKNIAGEQGGGLTFDAFLNALSGIEGANGILKVLTTNRLETLDEALGVPRKDMEGVSLSTRPGRADRAIELGAPDEAGRRKIAKRILEGFEWHVEPLVAAGATDSGAQFTDRCARIALEEYWRARENKLCQVQVEAKTDSGRSITQTCASCGQTSFFKLCPNCGHDSYYQEAPMYDGESKFGEVDSTDSAELYRRDVSGLSGQ